VLDGGGDHPRPAAARAVEGPLDGPAHGRLARGHEGELGRADTEAGGDHLGGLVEQAPRGACLGVQAPRIGPARVERGEQGFPRHRVHRRAGGVEDDAAFGVVRHTPDASPTLTVLGRRAGVGFASWLVSPQKKVHRCVRTTLCRAPARGGLG